MSDSEQEFLPADQFKEDDLDFSDSDCSSYLNTFKSLSSSETSLVGKRTIINDADSTMTKSNSYEDIISDLGKDFNNLFEEEDCKEEEICEGGSSGSQISLDGTGSNEENDGVSIKTSTPLKDPTFVPRHSGYFFHDDRLCEETDSKTTKGKLKPPKEVDKLWKHDLFDPNKQTPKTREELIEVYGFDIRKSGRTLSKENNKVGQRKDSKKPCPRSSDRSLGMDCSKEQGSLRKSDKNNRFVSSKHDKFKECVKKDRSQDYSRKFKECVKKDRRSQDYSRNRVDEEDSPSTNVVPNLKSDRPAKVGSLEEKPSHVKFSQLKVPASKKLETLELPGVSMDCHHALNKEEECSEVKRPVIKTNYFYNKTMELNEFQEKELEYQPEYNLNEVSKTVRALEIQKRRYSAQEKASANYSKTIDDAIARSGYSKDRLPPVLASAINNNSGIPLTYEQFLKEMKMAWDIEDSVASEAAAASINMEAGCPTIINPQNELFNVSPELVYGKDDVETYSNETCNPYSRPAPPAGFLGYMPENRSVGLPDYSIYPPITPPQPQCYPEFYQVEQQPPPVSYVYPFQQVTVLNPWETSPVEMPLVYFVEQPPNQHFFPHQKQVYRPSGFGRGRVRSSLPPNAYMEPDIDQRLIQSDAPNRLAYRDCNENDSTGFIVDLCSQQQLPQQPVAQEKTNEKTQDHLLDKGEKVSSSNPVEASRKKFQFISKYCKKKNNLSVNKTETVESVLNDNEDASAKGPINPKRYSIQRLKVPGNK